MKTIVRRIRNLEDVHGLRTEGMRKAAVPSAAEMIVERLAAGGWQCAQKLLELPEQKVRQEWQSSVHWGRGLNRMLDIGFKDLTLLRETLSSSLAGLPPELRWNIARQLLAAGTRGRLSNAAIAIDPGTGE